jgi:hypothetical protein
MEFNSYITPKLLRYGIQYYISGRHTFFCSYFPVSANLFHHASEMILKAELSNQLTYDDVVKLNHKLKKIWEQYKSIKSEHRLLLFDAVIAKLDKFEYLRYPKEPARKATHISFGIYKEDSSNAIEPPFPVEEENRYNLNLEEIDELFHYLITSFSLSPQFIQWIIGERGLETYRLGNHHLLF